NAATQKTGKGEKKPRQSETRGEDRLEKGGQAREEIGERQWPAAPQQQSLGASGQGARRGENSGLHPCAVRTDLYAAACLPGRRRHQGGTAGRRRYYARSVA